MNKKLKKLLYQYKFLKMEFDDVKEEHSELAKDFELLFADIISKKEPQTEEDTIKTAIDNANTIKEKKPEVEENKSVKSLYKDVAKKLHPDKGGTEESFKKLNNLLQSSDFLGIVELAIDNNIDVDMNDGDIEVVSTSISKYGSKIAKIRETLPYVWEYGSDKDRMDVVLTLCKHIDVKLNPDDLSDEIKDLIGINKNDV